MCGKIFLRRPQDNAKKAYPARMKTGGIRLKKYAVLLLTGKKGAVMLCLLASIVPFLIIIVKTSFLYNSTTTIYHNMAEDARDFCKLFREFAERIFLSIYDISHLWVHYGCGR